MADEENPNTGNANDVTIITHIQQETEHVTVDNSVQQIIDHLKECADAGEFLGIYQIAAFRSMQPKANLSYYRTLFLALLAMATQMLGMTVVLYQEIEAELQLRGRSVLCPDEDPLSFKVMATLFCLTLCVFAFDSFNTFRTKGMYRVHPVMMDNKPDCLNPYWICLGRYVKNIVMLMVLYGSFFLVHFSPTATDIVLNAVAMFFMLELDGLFANQQDYKDFNVFLETYEHKQTYEIPPWFLWLNRLVYFPFAIIILISLVMAVPFSFVIGICH